MIDFATLKSRIKDTAESAGRIAGDMVELTRMKMQVVQYKSELSKAHEKLGAMIYNMMKVDEEDTSAVNVCIDEIDYILDKIQEAEDKVKELRKVSCCQSCGMEIPVDACFCPKCGAKIERPVTKTEEPAESEEAEVSEEAETPETPEAPEVSETVEASEAPETPETSEAPEEPKEPESF